MLKLEPPVGYTCKDISAVIDTLKEVEAKLSLAAKEVSCEALKGLSELLDDQKAILESLHEGPHSPLESLRSANSSLMECGMDLAEYISNFLEDGY